MNHLEAQSYIIPFIEHRIPDSKQEDFVMHMQSCPKCHEELEVYYTLLVGMQQLDHNEKLCSNFEKDLDLQLVKLGRKVRNRRGVRVSAFSIVMALAITFGILFYGSCISRVYNFEQATKKEYQGEYYFADSFYPDLTFHENDYVEEALNNQEEKITDFQRIRKYRKLRDDQDKLLQLTDKIAQNDLELEKEKKNEKGSR